MLLCGLVFAIQNYNYVNYSPVPVLVLDCELLLNESEKNKYEDRAIATIY